MIKLTINTEPKMKVEIYENNILLDWHKTKLNILNETARTFGNSLILKKTDGFPSDFRES